MTPTTFLGVIVFVGILLPGFSWLWVSERRCRMVRRPATMAVVQVAVVGAGAALVASVPVLLLGSTSSWFLDASSLLGTEKVHAYLAANLWPAVWSIGSQLGLGMGLAALLAVCRKRERVLFNPVSTVLDQILETDRVSREELLGQIAQPFVALRVSDGTVIEGYLRCFPTDLEEPYLAVESPVFMTQPNGDRGRHALVADVVVVNLNQIAYAAVCYKDPTSANANSGSEHRPS